MKRFLTKDEIVEKDFLEKLFHSSSDGEHEAKGTIIGRCLLQRQRFFPLGISQASAEDLDGERHHHQSNEYDVFQHVASFPSNQKFALYS